MDTLSGTDIPRLDIPSSEDRMQLSPDTDRHLSADEDIDIDFDLEAGVAPDDEDSMIRPDGSDHTSIAGNDDEMIDDGLASEELDENTSLIDEDLGDAENSVVDDALDLMAEERQDYGTEQGVTNGNSLQVPENAKTNTTQGQEQYREVVEGSSVNKVQVDTEQPPGDSDVQNADDPIKRQDPANAEASTPEIDLGAHNSNVTESNADSSFTELSRGPGVMTEEPTLHDEEDAPYTGTRDEAGNPQVEVQSGGQEQPEFEHLHPVIVLYQGNEMSLFPPSDQDSEQTQTYLLHDETFAQDSISNLLQQCRLVLADSINERDKLEIKIPDLGLNIDESTALIINTDLAQIVDVYLHLTHNDGLDDAGPLYIELCVSTSCIDRLEYLLASVADGKGLSQLEPAFASENLDHDDRSDYPDGEADDEQGVTTKESLDMDSRDGTRTSHSGVDDLGGKLQKSPAPPIPAEEYNNDNPSNPDNGHIGTSVEDTEADKDNELSQEGTRQTEGFAAGTETEADVNLSAEKLKEQTTSNTIEYSDDEALAGDSSAGSSTLQGDIIDSKAANLPYPLQEVGFSTSDTVNINIQASEYDTASLDDDQYSLEDPLDQHALEDRTAFGGNEKPTFDENTTGVIESPVENVNDHGLEDDYEEANIVDDAAVDQSSVGNQAQMLKSHMKDRFEGAYDNRHHSGDLHEPIMAASSVEPGFDEADDPDFNISDDPTELHEVDPAVDDFDPNIEEATGDFDRFGDVAKQMTTGINDTPASLSLQRKISEKEVELAVDDADQITFDDEDYTNIAPKQSESDSIRSLSPRTLKRTRGSQEDDNELSMNSSEVKRVRST